MNLSFHFLSVFLSLCVCMCVLSKKREKISHILSTEAPEGMNRSLMNPLLWAAFSKSTSEINYLVYFPFHYMFPISILWRYLWKIKQTAEESDRKEKGSQRTWLMVHKLNNCLWHNWEWFSPTSTPCSNHLPRVLGEWQKTQIK